MLLHTVPCHKVNERNTVKTWYSTTTHDSSIYSVAGIISMGEIGRWSRPTLSLCIYDGNPVNPSQTEFVTMPSCFSCVHEITTSQDDARIHFVSLQVTYFKPPVVTNPTVSQVKMFQPIPFQVLFFLQIVSKDNFSDGSVLQTIWCVRLVLFSPVSRVYATLT